MLLCKGQKIRIFPKSVGCDARQALRCPHYLLEVADFARKILIYSRRESLMDGMEAGKEVGSKMVVSEADSVSCL